MGDKSSCWEVRVSWEWQQDVINATHEDIQIRPELKLNQFQSSSLVERPVTPFTYALLNMMVASSGTSLHVVSMLSHLMKQVHFNEQQASMSVIALQ